MCSVFFSIKRFILKARRAFAVIDGSVQMEVYILAQV